MARREDSGRRWAIIDGRGGCHHVRELGGVASGKEVMAGQEPEIRNIERAGVGGSIGADEAGAIEDKANPQPLERNVVEDLIERALEEGRVDGGEGT